MSVVAQTCPGFGAPASETVDVLVVGAGFSGVYAIHRLRQAGHSVLCFEAGDGVGGTWYWNRYPGARVDIESVQYSYSFDEALQQEWKWPELFSRQEDIERYINHVVDRFDLRRSIRLNARVDSVAFDEGERRWRVSTEAGHRVTAKYIVAATGPLDATNIPSFPGADTFTGEMHHTSQWPREGVDLQRKRVGVIGTGSTGVQVVPEVARAAGHLHVFQRTPAYTVPAHNRPLDPGYEQEWKANYAERREMMRHHPNALVLPMTQRGSVFDHTHEERLAILEEAWESRSGLLFFFLFNDLLTDIAANEVVAEWFRGKIRETVKDPEVAEMLCPTTYPLGAKRLSIDTGYYDSFNRDNVTLVDVRRDPIVRITPNGLRTEGAEYELDVLILATGFDAMTGSMLRMNVAGAGGVDLREKWARTPWNYLGLMVSGFPNLFLVHGPGSPSVLAQMVAQGEYQVNWIADLIARMEEQGAETVDTTPEAERTWCAEVTRLANATLFPLADSWQKGANIEGKPQSYMIWVGGFDAFADRCDDVAGAGYEGLVFKP